MSKGFNLLHWKKTSYTQASQSVSLTQKLFDNLENCSLKIRSVATLQQNYLALLMLKGKLIFCKLRKIILVYQLSCTTSYFPFIFFHLIIQCASGLIKCHVALSGPSHFSAFRLFSQKYKWSLVVFSFISYIVRT